MTSESTAARAALFAHVRKHMPALVREKLTMWLKVLMLAYFCVNWIDGLQL